MLEKFGVTSCIGLRDRMTVITRWKLLLGMDFGLTSGTLCRRDLVYGVSWNIMDQPKCPVML
jgi:hypothetical protein